ncbi:hypothetical protein AG1IA_00012 [Rhizoctonia solani AG-1 IA]|uniref:Uncharacterized protein n=1 Tax=Thanatephorus cucumeris (strain AG1-IA) TaxID=983506 RepID=L8XA61_THACA|nr:hypothetical protein AG1IA_00012 [Rhizoctonia solani AG-1 IA]
MALSSPARAAGADCTPWSSTRPMVGPTASSSEVRESFSSASELDLGILARPGGYYRRFIGRDIQGRKGERRSRDQLVAGKASTGVLN